MKEAHLPICFSRSCTGFFGTSYLSTNGYSKILLKGLSIATPALYVIGHYPVLKETVWEYSLRSATARQHAVRNSKG